MRNADRAVTSHKQRVEMEPRGRRSKCPSFGSVVVRNHGPGIDEADLPLVFERFYRSPAARGTAGSGLGLAIVRHVVEAHGGSVEATNAPDGGAVFTLRFPVAP